MRAGGLRKRKNPPLFLVLAVVLAATTLVIYSSICSRHGDTGGDKRELISSENTVAANRAPDKKENSGRFLVRAWNDPYKFVGNPVDEYILPPQSKQIDIYKTRHVWLSGGKVHSENVTIFFLWRSSSCQDDNRDNPQGLMRTLSANAKAYDVVIDIGACYGDTAVPLSTNANIVLAFEPNPNSFAVLRANADLNSAVRILPYNLAVGQDEELDFFYGGEYCNGGRWGKGR